MKSVKYFYTFHQICLTMKREQTQLHQIIIFDLKEISAEAVLLELSAEIVPNVCIRFGERNHRTTSSFLRDGTSRDLSKDATYFGAQFVFPLLLPFCSSLLPANKACVHTRLSLFYTNTMSRRTQQTLTDTSSSAGSHRTNKSLDSLSPSLPPLSLHPFPSLIALGRSSMLHPVYEQSCCM